MAVPVVVFSGSSNREIGRQHGSQLRDRIRSTWKFYLALFGESQVVLKSFAADIRDAVSRFDARYVEEMDAIAIGSGLDPWQIYCLNGRTEILLTLRGAAAECTSIFDRKKAVLAQNWDWDEFLESQVFVADINLNGHRIVTMTEPGMLAKCGMSSAGVATALNVLSKKPAKIGVPVHVLLRAALDAPSYETALEKVQQGPRGTSSHIFLAARTEQDGKRPAVAAMVEFAGDRVDVVEVARRFTVHTNHYVACDLADHALLGFPKNVNPNSACSRARYVRASDLVAQFPGDDDDDDDDLNPIEALSLVLYDGHNPMWPICRPMKKSNASDTLGLGKVGTVCTVFMDLATHRFLFTRGNPIENPTLSEIRC